MIEELATFAAQEFHRRRDRGVIDAAQHPRNRRRIEANCRAWLSAVLRLGTVPADAAALVADYAQAAPDWPASAHRAMAAAHLCPVPTMLRHIEHARAEAFAAAALHHDGHPAAAQSPAWLRFKQLDRLATALGSTLPVPIPAPSAHPEEGLSMSKARLEGRAAPLEQAA